MHQNVFVIGATGNVGRATLEQMIRRGDTDERLHQNPTRIVGVASSKSFIYMPEGMPDEAVVCFSRKEVEGRRYPLHGHRIFIEEALRNRPDGTFVFVDVTALKKDMLEFHKAVISETTFGIVTANKNPIVMADYDTFVGLTRHRYRYGFSCSVMAGANAVRDLAASVDLGERPTGIRGVFSGTINYIISGIEDGRKFSEMVREAMMLGYTEPHPASDLDGGDVKKKILILARTAGYDVRQPNIRLEPFIPRGYLARQPVAAFLERLPELDNYFTLRFEEESRAGHALRYIAEMRIANGIPRIEVGLAAIGRDDPFASLRGTSNQIMMDRPTPYHPLAEPGAGIERTAFNIRRDLLDQLRDRTLSGSSIISEKPYA